MFYYIRQLYTPYFCDCLLLSLPASTVSVYELHGVRPSVCLSVPSIDSRSDVQLVCCSLQLGRGQQISIAILPPAAGSVMLTAEVRGSTPRLVNDRSCSVQIVVLITLRLEVHSHRCLTARGAARCRASATRRTRPQYARSCRIR